MSDNANDIYAPQFNLAGAIYATQFFTGLGPVNANLAKSGMSRLDLIRMYEKAIAERHGRAEEPDPDDALRKRLSRPRKRKLMRRERQVIPAAPVLNKPPAPSVQVSSALKLKYARDAMQRMVAQHVAQVSQQLTF